MFYYGWLNSDILDLQAYALGQGYNYMKIDVTKPLPFPNEYANLIFSSHLIEHLSRDEGIRFMVECSRILKPGGCVRIATPNIKMLMRDYNHDTDLRYMARENDKKARYNLNSDDLDGLAQFRHVNVGVAGAPTPIDAFANLALSGHKSIYDEDSLRKTMEDAGLKVVQVAMGPGGKKGKKEKKPMLPGHQRLCIEQSDHGARNHREPPHAEPRDGGNKMNFTQEIREKMSNSWSYEKHFPKEVKQKISDACSGEKNGFYGKTHDPQTCALLSDMAKQRIGERNPMFGKHHSKKARRKISESLQDPSEETRNKISLHRIGKCCGEDNPNWNGGSSFLPYCEKFNKEFKERVRAFFEYKCVECGKTQLENKKKLHVHHVNYDKMVCCNDIKPIFVALFTPHHAKANYNREYWEEHFIEIINEKYNGQCYLPRMEAQ